MTLPAPSDSVQIAPLTDIQRLIMTTDVASRRHLYVGETIGQLPAIPYDTSSRQGENNVRRGVIRIVLLTVEYHLFECCSGAPIFTNIQNNNNNCPTDHCE